MPTNLLRSSLAKVFFFDFLYFLGCATKFDSFLNFYKTSETRGFLTEEWLKRPEKLNDKELSPREAFHNKLRNCNPLEKKYLDYEKQVGSGLTTESAVVKNHYHCSEIPPTGAEK